mmetsp:Transcript_35626/g.53960  ORF Transcript_35626/g.53960 Transcript_35626/m.53960 type:complete len:109 (+) Transcript_35626:184-510(+)
MNYTIHVVLVYFTLQSLFKSCLLKKRQNWNRAGVLSKHEMERMWKGINHDNVINNKLAVEICCIKRWIYDLAFSDVCNIESSHSGMNYTIHVVLVYVALQSHFKSCLK